MSHDNPLSETADRRFETQVPTEQIEVIFKYFHYKHLPEKLQSVSKPFHDLALQIIETLPKNAERTTALRKLLEAKDCAVRATL